MKEQYTKTTAAKQQAFNKETSNLIIICDKKVVSVCCEFSELQSVVFKSNRK